MDNTKGLYDIISIAVSKLRDDPAFGPRLSNKWLPVETWANALTKSGLIDSVA